MFKKIIAASSWLRVQKSKSMERMFYLSFLYLFLFFSLLLISCGEEKKGSDPSTAIGLLGLASGDQPSSESNDGNLDGVLPPIPPVVGPPALPGQPLNAPILNDPQTLVNNAPLAEDPSETSGQIVIQNITFQLPVHNQTTVTAYIGKRNMRLETDGTVINASNYTTLSYSGAGIWFRFFYPSHRKQKVILVARNEFGSSSKTINFSHNRDCAGAPLITSTIGDCDDYCIDTAIVSGAMEFKVKYKHGNSDFLYFQLSGTVPSIGADIVAPVYFEKYFDEPQFTPGVKSIASALLPLGNDYTCVMLHSFVQEEENQIFKYRELNALIRLE